jgi:hypothetical protein
MEMKEMKTRRTPLLSLSSSKCPVLAKRALDLETTSSLNSLLMVFRCVHPGFFYTASYLYLLVEETTESMDVLKGSFVVSRKISPSLDARWLYILSSRRSAHNSKLRNLMQIALMCVIYTLGKPKYSSIREEAGKGSAYWQDGSRRRMGATTRKERECRSETSK